MADDVAADLDVLAPASPNIRKQRPRRPVSVRRVTFNEELDRVFVYYPETPQEDASPCCFDGDAALGTVSAGELSDDDLAELSHESSTSSGAALATASTACALLSGHSVNNALLSSPASAVTLVLKGAAACVSEDACVQ